MANDMKEKEQTTEESSDETTTQASYGRATPLADDFDIESYRLTQNYASLVDVQKVVITVPVRKPDKQSFVRVHPDWYLETAVLEDAEDRSTYLVVPSLWPELSQEITPKILFGAVSANKVFFLWPIRLPSEDGRSDNWNESALEAAQLARKNWVRVRAKMALGAYEVLRAGGSLGEPEWPQGLTFNELVKIAFKGRIITNGSHPVLKRLRGE